MNEFGTPSRNATQDANEGRIAPPAERSALREFRGQRIHQSNNQQAQFEALGSSMGRALSTFLERDVANIRARQAAEAAARVGQDTAVDSVSEMRKRTGWDERIFGQDVGYRAAQQAAVTNKIKGEYLELATRIDEFSAETPEEFSKRISDRAAQIMDEYPDPETRGMALGEWTRQTEKLAEAHYKNHYGFAQQQNAEQFVHEVLTIGDMWSVESQMAHTPKEKARLLEETYKVFNGSTKKPGMSDIAWRTRMVEALEISLKAGNIGLYNAARGTGFVDTLPGKEAQVLKAAVSAHDTQAEHNLNKLVATSSMEMIDAEDPETLAELFQSSVSQIEDLEKRSSYTERAQKDVQEAKLQLRRRAEAAWRAMATKEVKRDKDLAREKRLLELDHYVMQVGQGEVLPGAAGIISLQGDPEDPASTADLNRATTNTMLDIGSRALGAPSRLSREEVIAGIIQEPGTVGKAVAQHWARLPYQSDLVSTLGKTFVQGWEGMIDQDTLQPTEQLKQMLVATEQFAQSPKFRDAIGAENYDLYQILKSGLRTKKTGPQIAKSIERYQANKGNLDSIPELWPTLKKETKSDAIRRVAGRYDKTDIGPVKLGEYMSVYRMGLLVNDGDPKEAEHYLKQHIEADTITVFGQPVQNAGFLNGLTSRPFEELMRGADSTELSAFLVGALVGDTSTQDTPAKTKLSEIPGLTFRVVEGRQEVYLDAPGARQAVPLTPEHLQALDQAIEAAVNVQEEGAANKKWLDFRIKEYLDPVTRLGQNLVGVMP